VPRPRFVYQPSDGPLNRMSNYVVDRVRDSEADRHVRHRVVLIHGVCGKERKSQRPIGTYVTV